ncbi:YppE family protein [Heyndrickxia acidicola]|uniref:YppE family protein n=1 Tax=Heyndrickxia acidicola TaxID=209389 RepID=A0ABU6MK29_9BACI|nr:YppE family protein [Heyndrickxia acidicola]MED1205036.1 YppE family protein [Heyndrickxia acidicola]
MEYTNVIDTTEKLLACNDFAIETYQKAREQGNSSDFFADVKPFADRVQKLCKEWLPAAISWVDSVRPKHLHTIQLKNTAENIQMVSIRCFYAETSLKQFNSHTGSIRYVLTRFLEEVKAYSKQ